MSASNFNPMDALNILKRLNIVPNPDGSLTRPKEKFPTVFPPFTKSPFSLNKDVPLTLNPDNQTWIRLFLPRQALTRPDNENKLPIVVFVHGGAFIMCSAATPVYHEFCSMSASQLGALIISVDYRLAPEHRLPAAYDDVLEALTWVKYTDDEWVKDYGDLSRCVLVGESAGGNIVYHAALMAAALADDLKPLIITGLVLVQPSFGGPERTQWELMLMNDPVLEVGLNINEAMWALALPVVTNPSHEYCDPTVNGGSKLLDRVRDLGWRVGVVLSDRDPLFDRDVEAVELVKFLERRGVNVKFMSRKGEKHGVFISDTTHRRMDLFEFLMYFLS